MKYLVKIVWDFFKKDFNVVNYSFLFGFLSIAIFLNWKYEFHLALQRAWIGEYRLFLYFFLFYATAYYAVSGVQYLVRKKQTTRSKSEYWIQTLSILTTLSIASGLSLETLNLRTTMSWPEYKYFFVVFEQCKKLLVYSVPFWLLKRKYNSDQPSFYGLTLKSFDVKPYLLLLALMLPVIAGVSFQGAFSQCYPQFKHWEYQEVYFLPQAAMAGFFELLYLMDFIMVELLFRGIMILGLARILGKEAILPMVSCYCFLHFGKPIFEVVASIFGGYILGVIALKTKTILGGCMVHMGIAGLMEAAGYFHFFHR